MIPNEFSSYKSRFILVSWVFLYLTLLSQSVKVVLFSSQEKLATQAVRDLFWKALFKRALEVCFPLVWGFSIVLSYSLLLVQKISVFSCSCQAFERLLSPVASPGKLNFLAVAMSLWLALQLVQAAWLTPLCPLCQGTNGAGGGQLVVNICTADIRETLVATAEVINSMVKPPYFKNAWFQMGQQEWTWKVKWCGQEVERRRENIHIIEFLGYLQSKWQDKDMYK